MLTRLVRLFSGKSPQPTMPPVEIAPPVWLQPLSDPENTTPKPESVSAPLDPGAPYAFGEPVPRWPEHGAAMVAATPEQLVETQRELIDRIKGFSPFKSDEFDRIVMPVFHRYAAWVHLLPASEEHHHFGPGGLLAHGFEVALNATRLSDGRQVGTELTPSERAAFQPRWKVAAMLGGLLHDIGKPLVDCGATDPDRKITWSSAAGPLYSWLQSNGLTHYRFYWRPGKRHERHKPVGTSVTREIIGQELLEWLSKEPTQEVVNLMMTAIALGATPSNLLGQIVQKADEQSCDADLKRLAARTQGSGEGGLQSRAAVIMRELRNLLLNNQLVINKIGGDLFFTADGCFGHHNNLMRKVIAAVVRKKLPGFPQKVDDYYTLLEDTGFIEGYTHESNPNSNVKQTIFKLTLNPNDSDKIEARTPFPVIRFVDMDMVLGNVPMPPLIDATYAKNVMTDEEKKRVEASVKVAGESDDASPESADEAPSSTDATPESAGKGSTPSVDEPPAAAQASPEPYIANNRNRGDRVVSNEDQRRRDQKADERKPTLEAAFQKLENAGICGVVFVRLLQRIAAKQVAWGQDAFEYGDGVALRWPAAFEDLSVPSSEVLKLANEYKLLIRENGSSRDVNDQDFPDGTKGKCAVLGGVFMQAWRALRDEHPEIQNGVVVKLDNEAIIESTPRPAPANRGASGQQKDSDQKGDSASTGRNGQGSQARAQNGRTNQRPPKQERPVAGAAPAPHRDQAPAARENILATPNRPQPVKGRADAEPSTPQPEVVMDQRNVERPGYTRKENLQSGKSRISTETVSELTDQRREEINGYCWLFARRQVLEGLCAEDDSKTLVAGLTKYANEKINVRFAPFIEALFNSSNPAFKFTKPGGTNFALVRDLRFNPDYVPPEWVQEKLSVLKRKIANKQAEPAVEGAGQ